MSDRGTIVFVHGTGVRLKGYVESFEKARDALREAKIESQLIGCVWGDPLGADYGGLSLPDPLSADEQQRLDEDDARWSLLFDDPLFELERLTIPDTRAPAQFEVPGAEPEWAQLWNRIRAYAPSADFALLLRRGGLMPYWPDAWMRLVKHTAIPRQAFEQSFHELPEASGALARSAVAYLHVAAVVAGAPGPSLALREAMVARLIADWDQRVYGFDILLTKIIKRIATGWARGERNRLSAASSLPIGDVLLYQARGEEVRAFIRERIEAAEPPVTLLAHSLGGIACFELLALPDAPKVERLITIGSQSPYLYEIGALASLKPPQPLPDSFPAWLNVYDRNDLLSFVAARLFPLAVDFEAKSGQPFPDSHSAYLGDASVWQKIREFLP